MYVQNCVTGYDLTHPEQTTMIGCWANQCTTGLEVNTRKLKSGHQFNIIGGAFQRCTTGMIIRNLYEVTINTYFELNTDDDVILGDSADQSNYTKGVKNVVFASNTTNSSSNYALSAHACENISGEFTPSSSGSTGVLIYFTGYTKQSNMVVPNWTNINFDTQVVLSGSSATSCSVITSDKISDVETLTLLNSWSGSLKIWQDVTTIYIQGQISGASATSNTIATIATKYKQFISHPRFIAGYYYNAGWAPCSFDVSNTTGNITLGTGSRTNTFNIDFQITKEKS